MARWTRHTISSLVARVTGAAVAAAPRLRPGAVDALESAFAWAGPYLPFVARQVASNMRSAGLYSPQTHRDYFTYAAAHLAGVLHVLRYANRAASPSPARMHPDLDRLVRERVLLDDSFDRLREAVVGGKGVVLLGVHASNYMLVVARINQELPMTVYLRHSRDWRKQEAKKAWCRAAGVDFIAEPPGLLNPARRAEFMAAALQQGRILIVTPDLAQKREHGVPVRFLDREVYLPGGPAALSLLVGSPLVTVVANVCRGSVSRAEPARRYERPERLTEPWHTPITLHFFGPKSPEVPERKRGWRQAAVRERLQWFADVFTNEFLRPNPALWFLWGDKRWAQVFRGNSRYTSPPAATESSR